LRTELPQRGVTAVDHALQVHVHEPRVVRDRDLPEASDRADADVVDPDVDAAEARDRGSREALDVFRLADVGRHDQCVSTRRPRLRRHLFE
jgi:hypothetical protein